MPKRKRSGGGSGSAALRAYKSMPSQSKRAFKGAHGISGKATRSQRVSMGRIVRQGRLRSGRNPNTGGSWTAGQLGLKGGRAKNFNALTPKARASFVKYAAPKAGGRKGVRRGVRRAYSR